MRAVVQRVSQARVEIEGHSPEAIKHGLLVLLGIEEADNQEDVDWLAGKIARLRVFDDDQGVMNRSAEEVGGEIMVVSQFTLHASTKKGNRPSYVFAAKPDVAIPLYENFLKEIARQSNCRIAKGIFGAMMQVALTNDGPVTIIIDSKIRW